MFSFLCTMYNTYCLFYSQAQLCVIYERLLPAKLSFERFKAFVKIMSPEDSAVLRPYS